MDSTIAVNNDAKKVFRRLGTCSRTFGYLLNREFGNNSDIDEQALDPLAGGILQKGQQCGMLWGAAMAVGREAYHMTTDHNIALALALKASQDLVASFEANAPSVNCRAITRTDFSKKFQMFRYMLFRAKNCFNLAELWAPEAVEAAKRGLSIEINKLPGMRTSCASEVINNMGGNNEEMVAVSGFSGGIGLSGNACGALAAAIWKNTKKWMEANPEQSAYNNPAAQKTYRGFYEMSKGELVCHKICGKKFSTPEAHAEFISKGGCKDLIETLASIKV